MSLGSALKRQFAGSPLRISQGADNLLWRYSNPKRQSQARSKAPGLAMRWKRPADVRERLAADIVSRRQRFVHRGAREFER